MRPISVHDRQKRYKSMTILDLIIIMAVTFGIAVDLTSIGTVSGRYNLFAYYTIQTNILMMALCLWANLSQRLSRFYHWLRTGATLYILVTGLGYHFMLSSSHYPRGMDSIANFLLHYLVPLLALVTWGLYMRIYPMRWWMPFTWLIYPGLYIGGTLIRGYFTGNYLYWFLNPVASYPIGVGSYLQLGFYTLGIGGAFIGLGFIFSLINNKTQYHIK